MAKKSSQINRSNLALLPQNKKTSSRLRLFSISCNYDNRKDSFKRSSGSSRSQFRRLSTEEVFALVRKNSAPLAVAALGSLFIGPILGAAAVSLFGFVFSLAAVAAVFSLSWVIALPFLMVFGIPVLLGSGILSGLYIGAMSIAALLQFAFLAAFGYIGVQVFKYFFFPEAESDTSIDGGTIDVEPIFEDDLEEERRRREEELREFDELLKRRDRFRS